MATQSRIAGTVKIDGVASSRNVIVIKNDPAGWQVIAEGTSAGDGTFEITYADWAGSVIALAVDQYGDEFEAETALNLGAVVHPTTPNGYVYEVTAAGTTGATEPTWSTSSSVTSGGVTFNPRPYYRPVASGPLQGDIVAIDFTAFEAYFADLTPAYFWMFNEESGPLIRKPDDAETAFPGSTAITRGQAGLSADADESNLSYNFPGGVADYIDLGLQSDFMDSDYTISVAVQLNDYEDGRLQFLVGSTGTANRYGFYIGYDNRQSLSNTTQCIKALISPQSSAWELVAADNAIADNLPHIITLVCRPLTGIELYVDGVEVASSNECPSVGGSNTILVGNAQPSGAISGDFAADAKIDNFGIWLEAKSPEWVEELAAKFFEESPAP